ncbi:MAG: PA14 domain-containing protein [Caldilineaceae bacterium]
MAVETQQNSTGVIPRGVQEEETSSVDNGVSQGDSPGSVDSPTASSGSVTVTSVRTADLNGNTKTTFNAGDGIRYYGTVKNTTGKTATVYFVWSLTGPCGSTTMWAGNLNTGPGVWLWNIDSSTPTNCPGTYKYTLSVTYKSKKSSKNTNFVVGNPSLCPNNIPAWKGEYWNNQYLSGNPVVCRNDNDVNFDWGSGSPDGRVPSDHFSARWTRTLYFSAGLYRFHLRGDDGIRLWVDGVLLIDQWHDQGATEYTADRNLSGGNHYLEVQYYENVGGALVSLWWEYVPIARNLALGQPAYATSQEASGFEPYRANDGNYGTRWSSQFGYNDEWWWVDLGSQQTYDRVVIRWEVAYAGYYFVGWSNDGNNFTGNWYTLDAQRNVVIDLGAHTSRYVGILMRQHAPCCTNYSFWEFEVWRTAGVANVGIESAGTDYTKITPNGDLVTIQMTKDSGENKLFLPFVQQ